MYMKAENLPQQTEILTNYREKLLAVAIVATRGPTHYGAQGGSSLTLGHLRDIKLSIIIRICCIITRESIYLDIKQRL